MAELVYISGAVLSVICALMLLRGYRRNGLKLLLWSALCFVALSVNNVLLLIDLLVLGPDISLAAARSGAALVGLALLVYGLVTEST